MWSNIIFERDRSKKQYLVSLKKGYDYYLKDSEQKRLEEAIGDKD